jgi:hypothetical protein
MKLRLFAVAMALLVAPSVFSKNPPPLRGNIPPVVNEPAAVHDEPREFAPLASMVPREGGSGTSSHAVSREAREGRRERRLDRVETEAVIPDLTHRNRIPGVVVEAVPSYFEVAYHSGVSSDNERSDNEPSITAVTKDGVTTHIMSWQKTMVPYQVLGYTARYTESNGTVTVQPVQPIQLPSAYTNYSDSFMGVNPYATGVRPYGVYRTAVTYNLDNLSMPTNPQSVRLWVSSDQGATWNATGVHVASTTATDTKTLDKPTLDVSWYSGTLGWVYVTWIDWGGGAGGKNRVLLRRSPSGGSTRCRPYGGGCIDPFDPVVVVDDGSTSPQGGFTPAVVVNSTNGHVYVVYTTHNGIFVKVSTDLGATFPSAAIQISPLTYLSKSLPTGARAPLVPMARYNPVTQNLMVVWHDATIGQPLDVFFATINPSISSTATVRRYTENYDQFQPAVDNDDSGNALIHYYDNAPGGGFSYFQPRVRYVDSTGNSVLGPNTVPDHGILYNLVFTGDYHEVYYWGNRWNAAWTRTFSSRTDTTATGIR